MRKFHEAKLSNAEKVEIWGSGSPMREFLIVDDLADACLFIMKNLGASELYSQNISHITLVLARKSQFLICKNVKRDNRIWRRISI